MLFKQLGRVDPITEERIIKYTTTSGYLFWKKEVEIVEKYYPIVDVKIKQNDLFINLNEIASVAKIDDCRTGVYNENYDDFSIPICRIDTKSGQSYNVLDTFEEIMEKRESEITSL